MNFKNILSVSVIALLGVVNAAPITSGTKTIPSAVSGTKSLPSSTKVLPTPKYEEFNILEQGCKMPTGFPLVEEHESSVTYSCLRYITGDQKDSKVNPENSACLYAGDNVFCVDSEVSNIEECSKAGDKFDYDACMAEISHLIDLAKTRKFSFYGALRTYPKKEKIESSPRKDQKECADKNGVVLHYQTVFQYICLAPEGKKNTYFDKHCQSIDGTTYCVDEENSNIPLCMKSSKEYNFEQCLNLLLLLGKNEHINVV